MTASEYSRTVAPPLALYVHLPWCERKCPYCDFNSHESATIPEDAYVETLIRDLEAEIASAGNLLDRPLVSIFFGGGTPSLFSADAIARLLGAVRERIGLAKELEITLEANPSSAERTRMRDFVDAGITRFSLGIQSFQNSSLDALDRIHDAQDSHAAIRAVRDSGAHSFNLDLMHGLPGQSRDLGMADLQAATAATPPHISWYQLTIEPNTRFFRFPPELPDEETLGDLEYDGTALLEAAGYRRYEVSAWARPGEECRHNLNYWRFGDHLAIGAGAHGKLTSRDGRILRYRKTRRPEDYLKASGTRRCEPRYLGRDDRVGEFMLGALRLIDGFDIDLFEARTGLARSAIDNIVNPLVDRELLERRGPTLRTSALGLRFLDTVVGHFFSEAPVLARQA